MSKRVLVPLAEGFEEIEAVTVVDVLRRAEVTVVVAGVDGDAPVKGSRGVVVCPDTSLEAVTGETFDLVVLPGGMAGTMRLREDPRTQEMLTAHTAAGGLLAAICAAPLALEPAGLTSGRAITSHPSVAGMLTAQKDYREDRVVVDGSLITSRGPGTSLEFALALVERLCGAEKAGEVAAPLVLKN